MAATGFNADTQQLGALADKVSGIGDSLASAAKTLTSAVSGGEDFGQTDLTKAVTQLTSTVSDNLTKVQTTTNQLHDSLKSTASNYSNTDQSNSANLTNAAGGSNTTGSSTTSGGASKPTASATKN